MIIASSWYICNGSLDQPADWYSDPECTSPIGGVIPGAGETVFVMQTSSANSAIINYTLELSPGASLWCENCNVNGGSVTVQSDARFDISGESFVTNGSIQNQGILNINYGRSVFSSSSLTISGGDGLSLSGGAELSIDTGPLMVSGGGIALMDGILTNYSNSSFRKTGGNILMGRNSTLRNNNPTQYQLTGAVGESVSFNPRTQGADIDDVNFNVLRVNTPTTWSVDILPSGLNIDSATGLITGTPTTATSGTFYITAVETGPSKSVTTIQAMTFSITSGVPAAVSNPSAAVGDSGSATVSWSVPTSDGGSPILFYYITSTPAAYTATTSTSTLSYVFENITEGQAYVFDIYAVSDVGTSSATSTNSVTRSAPQPVAPSTPTTPSAPTAGGSAGASASAPAGTSPQAQNSSPDIAVNKNELSPDNQVVNNLVKYIPQLDVFEQNTRQPERVIEKNNKYVPEVCPAYINEQVQFVVGITRDKESVKKLQTYLNTYHDAQLAVDGEFKAVDKREYDKLIKDHAAQIKKDSLLISGTDIDQRAINKFINKNYCEETKELACPYFTMYVKKGDSSPEVLKIKKFLNNTQDENLAMTSMVFDSSVEAAVKRFQKKYETRVLDPWGLEEATGVWYQSTRSTADYILGCYNTVILSNGKVLK